MQCQDCGGLVRQGEEICASCRQERADKAAEAADQKKGK